MAIAGGLLGATSVYFQASIAVKPVAAVQHYTAPCCFCTCFWRSPVLLGLFLLLSLWNHLLHARHCTKLSGWATFGCCWSNCPSLWLYIHASHASLSWRGIHCANSLLAPLQPSGLCESGLLISSGVPMVGVAGTAIQRVFV